MKQINAALDDTFEEENGTKEEREKAAAPPPSPPPPHPADDKENEPPPLELMQVCHRPLRFNFDQIQVATKLRF